VRGELATPKSPDACLRDQQVLVRVLRKDQDVRIRTDTSADVAKRGARHVATGHPQIYLGDGAAACDDGIRDPDLAIELERARLDGNGTRGRRRLGKADRRFAGAPPAV
jgi:hypothetical protein